MEGIPGGFKAAQAKGGALSPEEMAAYTERKTLRGDRGAGHTNIARGKCRSAV